MADKPFRVCRSSCLRPGNLVALRKSPDKERAAAAEAGRRHPQVLRAFTGPDRCGSRADQDGSPLLFDRESGPLHISQLWHPQNRLSLYG